MGEFNTAWYHADTATYDNGGQTAQALALQLGAAPDAAKTAAALQAAVAAKGHHFYTGIIGFKYLFDGLNGGGFAKDALAVLEQTDYPSIGYEFANSLEPASDNLWELPDAPAEGTGMNSRNHHMYSSFSHYLVAHVAGVAQCHGTAGHRSLILRPAAGGALDVSAASVSLDTARGRVVHAWRREGGAQCGKAAIGDEVSIDCGSEGGVVSAVRFASFGAPSGGACRSGSFIRSAVCHSAVSEAVVREHCLGRRSCTVAASPQLFAYGGPNASHCGGLRLWVDMQCSAPQSLHVRAEVPVSAHAEVHFPSAALGLDAQRAVVSHNGAVLYADGAPQSGRARAADSGGVGGVIVADIGSGVHHLVLNERS